MSLGRENDFAPRIQAIKRRERNAAFYCGTVTKSGHAKGRDFRPGLPVIEGLSRGQ
jgi:hypothetical protein